MPTLGHPTTSKRSPTRPDSTLRLSSRVAPSLYPSLAQRVSDAEVLRVLLSIGPTEAAHFQTWSDKAGNAPALTDPTNGLVFPDLNSTPFGGEDFKPT